MRGIACLRSENHDARERLMRRSDCLELSRRISRADGSTQYGGDSRAVANSARPALALSGRIQPIDRDTQSYLALPRLVRHCTAFRRRCCRIAVGHRSQVIDPRLSSQHRTAAARSSSVAILTPPFCIDGKADVAQILNGRERERRRLVRRDALDTRIAVSAKYNV